VLCHFDSFKQVAPTDVCDDLKPGARRLPSAADPTLDELKAFIEAQ
jgi:hypothetical protein